MKPEYEKLVAEVAKMFFATNGFAFVGDDIFASDNPRALMAVGFARELCTHIAGRLAEVTPEMAEAWQEAWRRGLGLRDNPSAQSDWRAMLAASPLTPGDERTKT